MYKSFLTENNQSHNFDRKEMKIDKNKLSFVKRLYKKNNNVNVCIILTMFTKNNKQLNL
jgi:hypothetical protein